MEARGACPGASSAVSVSKHVFSWGEHGSTPVIIRKGSEADIEQVSRLWLDMVRELNPSYTPSIEWWKNITLGLMRFYENYHLFVAEAAQDAVGFLDFMTVPEPATGCAHAVCRHLYVRPERRNSGISNSLLRQFNESAKMDGAAVLERSAAMNSIASGREWATDPWGSK